MVAICAWPSGRLAGVWALSVHAISLQYSRAPHALVATVGKESAPARASSVTRKLLGSTDKGEPAASPAVGAPLISAGLTFATSTSPICALDRPPKAAMFGSDPDTVLRKAAGVPHQPV